MEKSLFPNHRRTPQKRGFTLIELLIVIAIIALLAAILFPVFARARENARRASCQSNLRQIGLGFEQYKQDYDGWIPGTNVGGVSWPTLMDPYIKSSQVYQCPSTKIGSSFTSDTRFVATASTYYGGVASDGSSGANAVDSLSYSRNVIPRGGTGGNTTWFTNNFYYTGANGRSGFVGYDSGDNQNVSQPLNESAIADAAGTIHIFDAMATTNNGISMRAITDEKRTDHFTDSTASKVSYRHLDGFNALFGDGHVKFRRFGSTTANEWTIQNDKPDGTLN